MTHTATKPGQWIVRMNHRNRSYFFVILFAVLATHMAGKDYGPVAWFFLGLQFLVYPQLVYFRAMRAREPGRAEINNMLLDTLAMGLWAAALGFPLWITFILVIGATVNLAVFQGYKGIAVALAIMVPAGWLVVTVGGIQIVLDTSWPVTLMSVVSVFVYLMVVASSAHARTLKLHETRNELRTSKQSLQMANQRLTQQLDEIQALQLKLSEQANRDPLTGLYNRRYLDVTITRELDRCKREGQTLSLMLIDVDHFKQINDLHGHPAGDEVLKKLALMLQTRSTDVVCRYGGEEFLLLLPNMSQTMALARAEQFRKNFEATVFLFGTQQVQVTVSAGIASYPGQGLTPDALIRAADQALYQAKALGRNRVVAAGQAVVPAHGTDAVAQAA
jgi:diguanylate cyclase (GGDEF)-like protein